MVRTVSVATCGSPGRAACIRVSGRRDDDVRRVRSDREGRDVRPIQLRPPRVIRALDEHARVRARPGTFTEARKYGGGVALVPATKPRAAGVLARGRSANVRDVGGSSRRARPGSGSRSRASPRRPRPGGARVRAAQAHREHERHPAGTLDREVHRGGGTPRARGRRSRPSTGARARARRAPRERAARAARGSPREAAVVIAPERCLSARRSTRGASHGRPASERGMWSRRARAVRPGTPPRYQDARETESGRAERPRAAGSLGAPRGEPREVRSRLESSKSHRPLLPRALRGMGKNRTAGIIAVRKDKATREVFVLFVTLRWTRSGFKTLMRLNGAEKVERASRAVQNCTDDERPCLPRRGRRVRGGRGGPPLERRDGAAKLDCG